jgi:hypothetical protein
MTTAKFIKGSKSITNSLHSLQICFKFTGEEFLTVKIEADEIVYQKSNNKNHRTWKKRRDKVHMDWNDCLSELMSKFLQYQSFSSPFAVIVTKIFQIPTMLSARLAE